jgi:TRAP-type mannitol/chloroaromatic compound transport system substrate-binding protein
MKKYYINIIALILITACSGSSSSETSPELEQQKTYNWRLVTAWPKNYPGLGMAPERLQSLLKR